MSKNLSVLLVVIFFASLTSAFGGMPSTWEMFFKGFIVCFIFVLPSHTGKEITPW